MVKKLLIYGIGIFVSKILSFLMVPIYTRSIDPTYYGYYDVLVSDIQMIVSIAYAEIWSGILRYFIERNSKKDQLIIIRSIYPIWGISSSFYFLGLFFVDKYIGVRYPIETIIYGIVYMLFNVENCIARGCGKNALYVLSGLLGTFFTSILSIWFCVILKLDIRYLLIAAIIGYVVAAGIVEFRLGILASSLKCARDKNIQNKMIVFCIPLMINSISYSFLTMYNKNFILYKYGEIESAYYAIANKFAALITVATSIYQQAWQEESYIIYNMNNKAQLYKKNIDTFICVVGLAIGVIVLGISIIFESIIGENYHQAYVLVPIAIWGGFFSTFSGVIGNIFGAEKETKTLFFSTLVAGLINVFLINLFGIEYRTQGANVAILISFMVMAFVRYWLIRKRVTFKLELNYIIILLIEMGMSTFVFWKGEWKWNAIGIIVGCTVWIIVNNELVKRVYLKCKSCTVLMRK